MMEIEGAPVAMQEPQDKRFDPAGLSNVKNLPPAAQRALAEAKARHNKGDSGPSVSTEVGGRQGPEPVRYGDWEVKGIATDF